LAGEAHLPVDAGVHRNSCTKTELNFLVSRQLIQEALQQAEECAPAVQAAAFVHIARVLAVFDKDAALSTVARGLALADALPEKDRIILMPELVAAAAAVSPDSAFQFYASLEAPYGVSDRIAITMIDHGHVAKAARYLSDPGVAGAYPFMALENALSGCTEDPEAQRAVLRGAMTVVRRDFTNSERHHFLPAFNRHWQILPPQEAADFVREVLDWVLQQPDEMWSYNLGYPGGEVRFASSQQSLIFEILGPLRHLDPQRAESLIQQYPELAKAAAVFPYGQQEGLASIPSPEPTPETPVPSGPLEWDPTKLACVPAADWMETCWEDLFKQAIAQFDDDTAPRNPNRAPHEVWPSTQSFRQLMYRAGRYEGTDGVSRLKRIPDLAVRLLARIEFLAGLLDLPILGYSTRPPMPLADQMSEEDKELEAPNLASLPVRWEGHGQVRKISTEIADWDPAQKDWAPPRHRESSTFRPDGQLEVRSSALASVRYRYDGNGKLVDIIASREGDPQKPFTCVYDDRGRIVRVTREAAPPEPELPCSYWGMMGGGCDVWFEMRLSDRGMHVMNPASVTIRYDEERPVELLYVSDGGMLSCQAKRTWNAAGLLETETMVTNPPGDLPPMPESVVRFAYDSSGRCTGFENSMHENLKYRSTCLYDDQDNMIEAGGAEGYERCEYDYDAQGNWTQRATWSCPASESDYRPVKIERRTIEYAERNVESL
jgi:hypothetical protein